MGASAMVRDASLPQSDTILDIKYRSKDFFILIIKELLEGKTRQKLKHMF